MTPDQALAALQALGDPAVMEADARAGLARFGIATSDRVIGISVGDIRALAKQIGHDQALAEALWPIGWYEARLLAVFLADPARITPELMDIWRADFDNWASCDTACFHLFDRTPHAFAKVREWAALEDEYGRRAAFALLASVALHAKKLPGEPFLQCLPLIAAHAADGRNFVWKAVNWALRAIGQRDAALNRECVALSRRLAASTITAERRVGKDALKALTAPKLMARLGV
ncbi:DNA alkylation repair protein [Sphingomonas canadensis]|uniref:DNA alkylation repair protein n=1 Tax=Sphingomonas canadensis TaxID=1219257 RepID=A0ABW3H458_9SPHN|nr:DNA alkylation repair protein [Sphingomonas canadensis]MCW3835162.1 DNA alkylation repair protein [Sphingomonas canadensis]